MMPYNEDIGFERLKDMQREMEYSRAFGERTVDVLGLFAQPLIALVEAAISILRPLPRSNRDVA